MAKNSKNNEKKNKNSNSKYNKKVEATQTSFTLGMSSVLKCVVAVLVVLGATYLLTVYVTNKNKRSSIAPGEARIQYDVILAGESYNQKADDYMVLYFGEDHISSYSSVLSTYNDKKEKIPLYKSYTNEALNKKFVMDDAERLESDDPSSLRVSENTLIRFQDHKIVEYIQGEEDIISYLEQF